MGSQPLLGTWRGEDPTSGDQGLLPKNESHLPTRRRDCCKSCSWQSGLVRATLLKWSSASLRTALAFAEKRRSFWFPIGSGFTHRILI